MGLHVRAWSTRGDAMDDGTIIIANLLGFNVWQAQ
jgi:hypothetical protein